MTTVKNTLKLIAAAACSLALLGVSTPAVAGTGGSLSQIDSAIRSGSADAIIGELEQAEKLICGGCIDRVMSLIDNPDYNIREAAAWWFTKRPAQMVQLTELSLANLQVGDSIAVRNSADMLGTFRRPIAIAGLSDALSRSDVDAEAKAHIVQALGTIGHADANGSLIIGMSDPDPSVRMAAITAWGAIRHQVGAGPAVQLVNDSDNMVRRQAAAVVGQFRDGAALISLQTALNDSDPVVRRNAAWALGQIGDSSARSALIAATSDSSGLVRMTASNALRQLQ